jgi:AcrR family transcriptional regulator
MLDAAVRIFAERGYHGANMAEIAEAAGVTKPMVYAYFGSKEDLYLACIAHSGARLREALDAAGRDETEPERLLWERLLAFFLFVGDHRAEWRVLCSEAASSGGPFYERVAAARDRMIGQVAEQLAEVERAQGRPPTPPAELQLQARGLVGAGEALADWWVEHPEESAEAMALRLMNLVWVGFRGLTAGERWVPQVLESRM